MMKYPNLFFNNLIKCSQYRSIHEEQASRLFVQIQVNGLYDVEVTVKVKDNNDEDAEVSHGQVKTSEIPSLSRYILRGENLLGKNSVLLLMSISGKLDLCSR